MVGTANMDTNDPADAAVVNIKGTKKAIVIKVDCNGRYVHSNPEEGTAIAVAEAARNIVCSGGEPVAITNCLNFGNPYVPEVYWQFVGAIKGMKKACEKFNTPVTGGNVSFYNQSSDGGPVFPTPTIGMLGIMEDYSNKMSLNFKNAGDKILLIGNSRNDINNSEYLYSFHKVKGSPSPYLDLDEEYKVQDAIKNLIKEKVIKSAHDISDGGVFVSLAESAIKSGLGFDVKSDTTVRKDAWLFGESQSRVLVTVSTEGMEKATELLKKAGVEFKEIGVVKGDSFVVDGESFLTLTEARDLYENTFSRIMETEKV
jgi:phosphoribosylformylglycinamidine synthase